MTSSAVFTLNQAMAVEDQVTQTNSGIPGQVFDVIAVGMGYSENLEFVGTFAVGAGWLSAVSTTGGTASSIPEVAGYCTNAQPGVADCPGVFEVDGAGIITGAFAAHGASDQVPSLPSGSNTVSLIGETSGLTASTTFKATPAIAIYATTTTFLGPGCTGPSAPTILSTATSPGNKFLLCGVGFAKSTTIANAGSVTVGGVDTIESAIPTSSTGSFGPTEVTLASATSIGPLTISFDALNFNFANGNIESPGIFLGSNPGSGTSGALTTIEDYTSATYTATGHVGDVAYIFGYGYESSKAITAIYDIEGGTTGNPTVRILSSATGSLACVYDGESPPCAAPLTTFTTDSNGAFATWFTVPALPSTTPDCVASTASCWSIVDATTGDGTNFAPTQTFTITPQATFGGDVVTEVIGTATAAEIAGSTAFQYESFAAEAAGTYVGDYLQITSGADAGNTVAITASTVVAALGTETLTLATPGLVAAVAIGNGFQISALTNVLGSTLPVYNSFGYPQYIEVSGFATTSDSNTVTVTMHGVDWTTSPAVVGCETCTLIGSNGNPTLLFLPTIGHTQTTDFPGGSYDANASGTTSGNWAVTTNDLNILPIQADSQDVGTVSALSINAGPAGTTVALVSATSGGLHGLDATTAYTIMYDGTVKVGSFTSTASGEVPIGVSFSVPAEPAGLHIVDIQAAGVSAIYSDQLTGGQQFGGGLLCETYVVIISPYCDLVFNEGAVLTTTPSLVGAGQTGTIQGSGLPPSTALYVVGPNAIAYASFTSTSTGGVPSGVTFTVPPEASSVSCPAPNQADFCAGGELGTTVTWTIEESNTTPVGTLIYVYGTTAALSASSGSAGTSVTITANGLNAPVAGTTLSSNSPYAVVFNCIPSTNLVDICGGTAATGATPGNIIVGALIPNSLGQASTTITIPTSANAGTYVIQIVGTSGTGSWDLAVPLTFTVGAPSGVGDTTLAPGSPSQSTLNNQPDVQLTYTNTLTSSSINVVGYAVVTNALGQVVLYTTSETTLPASGSQTLYFILAGLPAATYTVTIYAISSTGLVISVTTPATAVIS